MSKVEFRNKVAPLLRNLKFKLPSNRADNWNSRGVHVSQFMNTLSVFFPAGERFFITSILNYRDQISDPQLQEDIKAFVGQESMHTREHLVYNQALIDAGFPVDKYMVGVEKLLGLLQTVAPKDAQLALTIALEHLTATLGGVLLNEPDIMKGSESNFMNVWNWHAMEEVEHKGVAYDVWNEVMSNSAYSYTLRVSIFSLAQVIFWSLVMAFHVDMVRNSKQLLNIKGWGRCMNTLWGQPGILRKISIEMLHYFRPGYHPWQNDNRYLLEDIEKFSSDVAKQYKLAAA